MKRILLVLLLLFFFPIMVFSAMSASSIYYASEEELENMIKARGLAVGSASEMRDRLYEYEGVEAYVVEETEENSSYNLSILSAESLEKTANALVITGNASISFSSEDSGEKRLQAGRIIVDTENKQITALENVSFHDDSENASINEITADIISIIWDSGELIVTDATTSSERNNSEGDDVTFYTTGNKLTYFPNGGILYEQGYISSDPENRYSSISADKIAMLPGGDMFISNAFLSIGRVPILYLPFFFFPGSRVLGNPAFGFDSSKGAFVNTTFELLGSSPDVEASDTSSSFTAILRSSDESGELVPVGYYYKEVPELNFLERWARDSESYISILADAYSGSSSQSRLSSGLLHLGLDSKLNIFGKRLKISLQDGIGLSNALYPNIRDSIIRYYGINSISFNDFGLRIDGLFPFYSDDYVLVDFKNRLTGFSIDPILGQDPTFPENYSSSLSSFTRSLNLSYTLPSTYTNTYLSSFSISNLRTTGSYRWVSANASSSYNESDRGKFILNEFEKPYLNASISGAIFEINGSRKAVEVVEEDDEVPESEIHLLSDPLLASLYEERAARNATSSTDNYSASLKYSISETLTNRDDYSYGRLDSSILSTSTSSKFTLSASLGTLFSFSDIITPTYSYSKSEEYLDDYTQVKTNENLAMSNEVTFQIPILGLSYTLATKLIDNEKDISWREGNNETSNYASKETIFTPRWDDDTVTQHRISFSKTISTAIGNFTPSISYALKPITGTIQPQIRYSYGGFAAAFSWKFLEKDEDYKSDLVAFSLGYNGKYFTLSSAMEYDSSEFDRSDFFKPFSMKSSASIRTSNKKWSITEYIDYSYLYNNQRNYFNAIRTTFTLPFASLALNWKTQADGNIDFNDLTFQMNLSSDPYQFWKGRIYLKFGLVSSFSMDMSNIASSTFTITPSLTFSIAEFLDFTFSFSSYNNNIGSYFNDDNKFQLAWMLQDLGRSFDFFGDGRMNTNFLLKNARLEVVHYMKDWDLHCAYSTEVVQSGNTYSLQPRLSIFLSWKTLPDLKVDQKWKQEYTNDGWRWVEE